ncbi:MAG: long-chain fatty acid--CoA ligase [Alphaproteobacteria bacterium]|nr:long-chain fatty acid--CoA ligase [Alphaproteobacteria bacterium]
MNTLSYPWLSHYPPRPQWDMKITPGLMTEALENTARKNPEKTAFDFLGKTYSWHEMSQAVDRFAAGLQAQGIGKSDKVGLLLPNCPLYPIAYYGILKTGATVVNYNPLYSTRELAHQIQDSETQIMVSLDLRILCDKIVPLMEEMALKQLIIGKFTDFLPFPKNILFSLFKKNDVAKIQYSEMIKSLDEYMDKGDTPTPVTINPEEDVAVLQYTGGTTGTPKGAMLTHANIHTNAVQAYSNFPDPEGHEIMLAVLPFFHVFAMTASLNMAILAGMEIVTLPRFDLDDVLKIIRRKKPHYMPAVPAIFNAINNHPRIADYDLSSLRFCISGGAPLPVEVKRQFEERTGCIVVEGYGLSETSPVVSVNPPFGENVAGSIGLPLPQTIVEIIDPEDKSTPLPIGQRGELCVRGPQVMKGYYNKPEETADVLRRVDEGMMRLYTGDIAIMDERGYIYIVDRIKDMIITNGYNVYPRNIEEAIYQHESVEECIVAGLPDAQRGEIVKAWIKLKNEKTLTAKGLREFLDDKISKMEMPREIEFREQPLPKTMIGKLSRKDIVTQELERFRAPRA